MRFDSVLVTGGAGRLGRYVVAELTGHCRVSVLDRAAGVDFPADVLDLDAVARALPGHDAVVHLAAIDVSVPAPPERLFDVNVRGTWNVLQAAHQAGVRRAVVCSSVAATGIDSPGTAPLYLPIDEAHPLRPTHPYGLSKEVDEAIARSFARRGGMEVIILRPAWVMFPEILRNVLDELAGLLPPAGPVTAADTAERAREPLPLLRSWVDPVDAARAFRLALGDPAGVGRGLLRHRGRHLPPDPDPALPPGSVRRAARAPQAGGLRAGASRERSRLRAGARGPRLEPLDDLARPDGVIGRHGRPNRERLVFPLRARARPRLRRGEIRGVFRDPPD